jgi:hypothetical protein
MAKMRIKIKGLKKVKRQMLALGKRGMDAYNAAVYAEGLSIMDEAVPNVPKHTGRLANSHWVSFPERVTGRMTIGFATKYAASVEHGLKLVDMSPKRRAAAFVSMKKVRWRKSKVGGPFFFRNAINSHKAGMAARLRKACKRYYDLKIGLTAVNRPDEPKTEAKARAKGERAARGSK